MNSVIGKHVGCGYILDEYTYPCGTYVGDHGYDYTVLCDKCKSKLSEKQKNTTGEQNGE